MTPTTVPADASIGRDAVTAVVANPSTLMMGALCMVVLIVMAALVTTGDVLIGGTGVGALAIAILSVACFWVAAGYEQRAPWTVKGARADPIEEDTDPTRPVKTLVLMTAVAGLVIFCAGYTLSQTGDAIAVQTDLGSGIVGFLLIGAATPLPELSTIITALRPV